MPTRAEVVFANRQPARLSDAQARIGPVCTVAIDVEEDFDWNNPVQGTAKSTQHLRNLRLLGSILSAYGARPTYLLTYPVMQDPDALTIIRHQYERGECAIGVQLHPWVTPPFGETPSPRVSFLGNLDANQQEAKLAVQIAAFEACFGFRPIVYRAGRYGLGASTPDLLEKHGFTVDTSIAPRTDFAGAGGPNYAGFSSEMFWFGQSRALLELPLCRDIVGWGGRFGPSLYRWVARKAEAQSPIAALLARSRFAERITLSPEGNGSAAIQRLVRGLEKRQQNVFPLSFHSSSLQAGRNPYVRSKADLHQFYDRLSETLDGLVGRFGARFVTVEEIPALLVPPAPALLHVAA